MCLSWANSIFHSCMKTYSILSMVFWKAEKIWKEMLAIKCPPLNSQIPFLFIFSSVNKCGGLNENFPTSSYFNTQSSLGGAVKGDIAAFLEEVCHWGPPKRVHNLIILALRYLYFFLAVENAITQLPVLPCLPLAATLLFPRGIIFLRNHESE